MGNEVVHFEFSWIAVNWLKENINNKLKLPSVSHGRPWPQQTWNILLLKYFTQNSKFNSICFKILSKINVIRWKWTSNIQASEDNRCCRYYSIFSEFFSPVTWELNFGKVQRLIAPRCTMGNAKWSIKPGCRTICKDLPAVGTENYKNNKKELQCQSRIGSWTIWKDLPAKKDTRTQGRKEIKTLVIEI